MLPLVMLAAAFQAAGQSGVVRQYAALAGDSVLIRTDNSTFVTCCNTTGRRSCFVVDDGSTCRRFYTTQEPSGIHVTDSGYVVKDMQLVNGVCWFAGYKWFDTGVPMYTPDGQAYNLVTYKAFIGRFNTADVLSGSGNYGIIEVSGLHHIERLAVIGNNATAIGVMANGSRRLVEMTSGASNDLYNLFIEESSMSQEMFMDVVAAGNAAVVLSRFNYPEQSSFHNYYFGLRYGTAGDMKGSSAAIHCYSTQVIYGGMAMFPSVHPMRLASTNIDSGVVVAYIDQFTGYNNPYAGKFILYHIPAEGSTQPISVMNEDNHRYTELVDIRFCKNPGKYSFATMLLRDSTGNSILRFPFRNTGAGYWPDKMLYTPGLILESIAPYEITGTGFNLSATGRSSGYSLTIELKESGIFSNIGFFSSDNCLSIGNSGVYVFRNYTSWVTDVSSSLTSILSLSKISFTNHSFTSSSVSRTTTCEL